MERITKSPTTREPLIKTASDGASHNRLTGHSDNHNNLAINPSGGREPESHR